MLDSVSARTLSMREKKESRPPPPPPPLTSGASSASSSSSSAACAALEEADGPCSRGGAYAAGPPVLAIVLPCQKWPSRVADLPQHSAEEFVVKHVWHEYLCDGSLRFGKSGTGTTKQP